MKAIVLMRRFRKLRPLPIAAVVELGCSSQDGRGFQRHYIFIPMLLPLKALTYKVKILGTGANPIVQMLAQVGLKLLFGFSCQGGVRS